MHTVVLLLEFSIAAQTYALPAKVIVEVVPAVPLRETSGQLPTLEYRGIRVPVLDLRQRYCSEPTACALATRIVLVGESGHTPALALLAERVTDTVRVRGLNAVSSAPTPVPAQPMADEHGIVRFVIELHRLIADATGESSTSAQDGA